MKEGLGVVNIQYVEALAFQFLCMKEEAHSQMTLAHQFKEIIYLVVLMRRCKVLKKH